MCKLKKQPTRVTALPSRRAYVLVLQKILKSSYTLFHVAFSQKDGFLDKKKHTILSSQKAAGTKFKTDTLESLSEAYMDVFSRYSERQGHIVENTVKVACSFIPVIEDVSEIISTLDVLLSFAEVSAQSKGGYVRPIMKAINDPEPELKLLKCRHPCLEVQESVHFISNNSIMDKNSTFIIITGPNMGGKSTYIRSIGVVTLLAQIGCFVPCDLGTVVTVRDCILARVGASDSQLRGVSTFMAEMLETSTILQTATKHSLLIIDELGRGTSTYDGFGLAYAISEYVIYMQKKQFFT